MDNKQVYLATADAVVHLVKAIRPDQWDNPGLGSWDVRGLVGHTGRAFVTVTEYLAEPSAEVTLATAADYLAAAHRADPVLHVGVAERGVVAGAELGDDPATAFAALRDEMLRALPADDPAVPTRFGGMPLSEFLGTRVFELVVHGTDIAAATGQRPALPDDGLALAVRLAGEAIVRNEQAVPALRLLTGRDGSALNIF